MNRTIALCAFAALFLAPASAQPDSEHSIEDIIYLPEYQPADAQEAEIEAQVARIADAARRRAGNELGLSARDALDSDMPIIARERLLYECARALGQVSDQQSLHVLLELASYKPQAIYLAPGCREHQKHLFYPVNFVAHQNAVRLYRILYAKEMQTHPAIRFQDLNELPELTSEIPDSLLRLVDSPFNKMYALMELETEQSLESLAKSEHGPELSRVLIQYASDHELEVVLHALTITDEPISIEAFRALARLSRRTIPLDLASCCAPRGENVLAAAMVALSELDATDGNIEVLSDTLSNERLGMDAALAFLRVDEQGAIRRAETSLNNGGAARKNALILLRQSELPEAREALRRFAILRRDDSAELAMLRVKVAKWIAE